MKKLGFYRWLVAFWWVLHTSWVLAQSLPLKEEGSFIGNLEVLYQRSTSPTAKNTLANFQPIWEGQLRAAEKTKIFNIARNIQAKNPNFLTHIENLLICVIHAVKDRRLPAEQIAAMLAIIETTAEERKYSSEALMRLLVTIRQFLSEAVLYKSAASVVSVPTSAKFSFEYATTGDKTDAAPQSEEWKPEELPAAEPPQTQPPTDPWDESNWEESGWSNTEFETAPKEVPQKTRPGRPEPIFEKPQMPVLGGAFIRIEPTDLTIRTSADTLVVKGTSGNFFIMQTRFIGKNGSTDWTRTGMPADAITCTFDEYHFDVRRPTLTAEHARLRYPAKTDSVVLGVFEYNSQRVANREKATYPRFKSYYANIPVKGIAKDVEYIGGFSLIGRNFSSANYSNRPSQVFIKKNGTVKFRAASRRNFSFTDSTISNPAAEIVIYINQGKDSITHIGSRLYYNHGAGKLTAVKERKEYDLAPFIDTYHQLEMYADRLRWDVTQDSMILDLTVSNKNILNRNTGGDSINTFENRVPLFIRSVDYFSEESYSREVKMLSSFNPIAIAVAHAKRVRTNGFTAQELAEATKLNTRNVRLAMRNMDKMGFLSYDDSTDWIELKRKAILYGNAALGLVDHDNIELRSITDFGKNIIINLTNNELTIAGVSEFALWRPEEPDQYDPNLPRQLNTSAKEGVWVKPAGGTVKVGKNREIIISGMIEVLKKQRIKDQYYGSDFRFNYEGCLVNMPKVDSIVIAQRDSLGRIIMDPKSGKPLMMQNKIQAASGILYVANPKNRSGRLRRYANDTTANRYPDFRAGAGAFIAFEGAQIEGSQSYKDRVRFDMDAFNLLGSNRAPGAERFGGTFRTNGIFPDFEEVITQQKDGSFGFVHKTSKNLDKFPKGYPLYTDSVGTAKPTTGYFEGEIILNNGGIRGNGNIRYLSAQLNSGDFMYYPDSVTTMSVAARGRPKQHNQGLIIAGEHLGTSYPAVEMTDFQLKWLARQDSMMLTTSDTVNQPFKMYGESTADQQSTFKGTLTLTPKVLAGDGIIDNKGAIAKSATFAFHMTGYTARQAEYFKIKVNGNAENPAMLATNVRIDYDLGEERKAIIETEVAGEQSFRFPYTKYKTSLGRALWNFDSKQIIFSIPEESSIENSVFSSTDPKRKGLSFKGQSARYDLNTYFLNVEGVPYIFSVDAHIIPDGGKVVVLPEGNIQDLTNCQIVVQAENRYHNLDKGNISVFSKHEYSGSATYHYKNDEGKEFEIPMQFVPSLYQRNSNREAILTVTKTKISEEQNLIWKAGTIFRGEVIMRGDSVSLLFNGEYRYIDLDNDIWFPAKGVTEITVATIEEVQNQQVGSGIFLNEKSKNIYTIYRSVLQNRNDRPIFGTQNGIERQEGDMRITETKGRKDHYVGNRFAFSKSRGVAEFEGKIDLVKGDARFNILAAAKGVAKYDQDIYSMQTLMAIKLEEGKGEIFKDIAKHIKKQVDLDETAIKNDDELLYKLANLISRSDLEDFQRRITRGRAEISDVLPLPLVLHNINLNWSEEQRAFYSKGKIHLSNIYKDNINLLIDGYIEIPLAGKQICNIYLQVSKGRWYYFSYQGNDIKMLTSDEELNKKIADPKSKDKFKLAEKAERLNFVNTFRQVYLQQGPLEEGTPDEEDTIEKDGDH
ncbi:MAG: hypothetical protein RMJ87_03050 [Cytophagales bacterium]|nr:hypothetical protein [Bernardetiaceae bacterium]MDW8203984.1 hypothetical protein [Cytophagales bacterium]